LGQKYNMLPAFNIFSGSEGMASTHRFVRDVDGCVGADEGVIEGATEAVGERVGEGVFVPIAMLVGMIVLMGVILDVLDACGGIAEL